MVIYYDLVAFKFRGKEDYALRDERGRNILLKKNDIIVLKEGTISRYLDYKKHLFRRVSIPNIINTDGTGQEQGLETGQEQGLGTGEENAPQTPLIQPQEPLATEGTNQEPLAGQE